MITGIVFVLLMALLLAAKPSREALLGKSRFEWLLDLANLNIQGLLIPWLQTGLLFMALGALWPSARGALPLDNLSGLLLNILLVDYLYYWNHRLMHTKKLFPVHVVHHTVTRMDVLATSRNTLWTSFFFVYLWVNGLLLYLTDLNGGFLLGMALTASLDLWKHSTSLAKRPGLQMQLSRLGLMTPMDHAWHHSSRLNTNFGANFNLFDRLHGTFVASESYPERLGVSTRLTPLQQLLFPFGGPK
ncbi:MAG: sterol desaturase family protein [Candidatus Melainabacteria bacterium HGW-Melainabacteria-1]|nr:MAG: sterol desaturase family protein [Candidatus Melainabacteria bacterium HGW-Melainabacteria-1]